MVNIRSDLPCPRCDGPANHPGACTDAEGNVYPLYAALTAVWRAQGRPALTPDEISALQESLQAAENTDVR